MSEKKHAATLQTARAQKYDETRRSRGHIVLAQIMGIIVDTM